VATQVAIYVCIGGRWRIDVGFAAIIAAVPAGYICDLRGRPYVAGIIIRCGVRQLRLLFGEYRPQMFAAVGSIFLLILERSDKRPGLLWWKRRSPTLGELHGGYLVGIGLMILFLAR